MAEQYTSPGWYPDPDGKPGDRWWNGAGWSDSRRGGVSAVGAPVSQRPDPYAPAVPVAPARVSSGITLDLRQNRFATLSLILGIIGVFGFSLTGPPAVVLGILGINQARALRASGATSSNIVVPTLGLVLGGVATFFLIVAIIGFVAAVTFDVSS